MSGASKAVLAQQGPADGVDPRRRRRRRRLLIFMLIGLSALPSLTTSYISISLLTEHALLDSDAWAPTPIDVRAEPALVMAMENMLPGDEHRGELTVANVGLEPLRYALVSATDDPDRRDLDTALHATVRTEGSGCGAFDGELLYQGELLSAGFGNPLAGSQAGDRVLGPSDHEVLCLRVVLPLAAGNRYQHARATTTFSVLAEHVAGAP